MGERIEDGGPVHPIPHGMSLRDWFAGRFASSIVGDREQWLAFIHDRRGMSPEQHVAIEAYLMADAMLAARAPSPSQEGRNIDAEVRHDL